MVCNTNKRSIPLFGIVYFVSFIFIFWQIGVSRRFQQIIIVLRAEISTQITIFNKVSISITKYTHSAENTRHRKRKMRLELTPLEKWR